jgi:hypothetical protein
MQRRQLPMVHMQKAEMMLAGKARKQILWKK